MSILDLRVDLIESGVASGNIASLMHSGVLRGNVEITQAPLQRRAIIDGIAASECEAGVDYANTSGGDPYCGLRTLDEKRVGLQHSRERVAPMAANLDLIDGSCRAKFGRNTPELKLECFRIAHRPSGPLLLMSAISQFD
jgi:hypothetical protein